jgi:hypothetical protein
MKELLRALKKLNSELEHDGVVLNLSVIGGFSLFLQNLTIEVRESHDIDVMNRLSEDVRKRVRRIGEELHIDLRWLNDDVLSLYDEFEFAGIQLEHLKFSPNTRIDFSNIHLKVIEMGDFLRLKLFSLFTEVYDFLQYGKSFERTQDLQDIRTILGVSEFDYQNMLFELTNYVQDDKYRNLTQALLDTYLLKALSNAEINDFLREQRA